MEFYIALFIIALSAAIIIPTLPKSRRTRLALAVVAIPVVIFGYQGLERRASFIGAAYMDLVITHSEELLENGKAPLLLAAYREYDKHHGPSMPRAVGPAYRAWLLHNYINQKEIEQELEKKP
jgi:hypothetical protein